MTATEFRRIALSLPEVTEQSHMAHPDFRAGGKVFATLGYPDSEWAMVKLSPELQNEFMQTEPKVFVAVRGAWGRRGCTNIRLKPAKAARVRAALRAAWRNTVPKRLREKLDGE